MEHAFDIIVGLLVGGYFIALGLGLKVQPEKLRGQKPFIVLGAVIILLGASILFMSKPERANLTPQQIVDGIKQSTPLPIQIDDATRLDAVEAGEHKLTYRFSVTAADQAMFANQIATIQGRLEKHGCDDSRNRRLLDAGISLDMVYGMSGHPELPPATVSLTPEGCGKQ